METQNNKPIDICQVNVKMHMKKLLKTNEPFLFMYFRIMLI